MFNIQTILNFIDERLKKIHKPDPELSKNTMLIRLIKTGKFQRGCPLGTI